MLIQSHMQQPEADVSVLKGTMHSTFCSDLSMGIQSVKDI